MSAQEAQQGGHIFPLHAVRHVAHPVHHLKPRMQGHVAPSQASHGQAAESEGDEDTQAQEHRVADQHGECVLN